MKLFFALGILLSFNLSHASLPLDLAGTYIMEGNCLCERIKPGNNCPEPRQVIGSLVLAPVSNLRSLGSITASDPGTNEEVRIYGSSISKNREGLKVRQSDQLIYQIQNSGSGYQITVSNTTLAQNPLRFDLIFPANQTGGTLDGRPAMKTVANDSSLIFQKYSSMSDAGAPAGTIMTDPGVQHLYETFSVVKTGKDQLTIRNQFDNRFSRWGTAPARTYSYGLLECRLKKKSE